MQHTDKMRAEFEAAYMRDLTGSSAEDPAVWLERGSDGEYRSYQARGAWWGWQASRRELVVTLVEPDPNDYASIASFRAAEAMQKECRAAIEAAGVTVRG